MEIGGTTNIESQDNRLDLPDQRDNAAISAVANWQVTAAPWMILAVWLTAAGGVVIYMATRSWGFLGNLLPLIMMMASLLAFATWLAAWSWLGESSTRSRIAFYLTGVLGMLAITCPLFHWEELDNMTVAAEFLIGLVIPHVVLRRRGWRIAISPAAGDSFFRRESWQFSIADIWIVVTGIAVILGLQAGHRSSIFEALLLGGVAIVGAPMITCFILSWRRIWLAVLTSSILGIFFAGFIDAMTWQSLVEVFLYVSAVFLAGLWVSLGWMRFVGYRIVRMAKVTLNCPVEIVDMSVRET